jgi:sulfopyruvate decarboxylase subunit beta|tara:strand:- start:221 stop:790 length:570 start_codon:yes stop_codon:yes gene_type:complete
MNRFELLSLLQETLQYNLVVCNIGLPSQELYKVNDRPNYFYMLGSMGLSSSIGLGLSLTIDKNVISIDGDGSVLMNMSTLATIGNRAPINYTLLIIDNGSYGSTGDQKTFTSEKTSLKNVAIGAGCEKVIECSGMETLENLNKALADKDHSYVIISKINSGNVAIKPIPLNPITIRDRFRRSIGLVSYL